MAIRIAAQDPPGWYTRVSRRPEVPRQSPRSRASGLAPADGAGDLTRPVLHAATRPLPAELADFGGELIDVLGADDAFFALIDHGPEVAGTGLFSRHGMPKVAPSQFAVNRLARYVPGRTAGQWFFTAQGHGFCLYAVAGAHSRRMATVPRIAQALATVRIDSDARIEDPS